MKPLFDSGLAEEISMAGVVAVLVIDDLQNAIPLALALKSGGINILELTLRTPVGLDAIKAIRREVRGIIVGAGTVLSPSQLNAARDAGASFAVSPGCNSSMLAAAQAENFSFAPGVAVPSDIEVALRYASQLMKFFPAEELGGLSYLRSIAAPYAHLGLRYMPLGGLTPLNAGPYLGDPLVAAIGGSWIASRDAIKAQDWTAIEANARAARRIAGPQHMPSSLQP